MWTGNCHSKLSSTYSIHTLGLGLRSTFDRCSYIFFFLHILKSQETCIENCPKFMKEDPQLSLLYLWMGNCHSKLSSKYCIQALGLGVPSMLIFLLSSSYLEKSAQFFLLYSLHPQETYIENCSKFMNKDPPLIMSFFIFINLCFYIIKINLEW